MMEERRLLCVPLVEAVCWWQLMFLLLFLLLLVVVVLMVSARGRNNLWQTKDSIG